MHLKVQVIERSGVALMDQVSPDALHVNVEDSGVPQTGPPAQITIKAAAARRIGQAPVEPAR